MDDKLSAFGRMQNLGELKWTFRGGTPGISYKFPIAELQ